MFLSLCCQAQHGDVNIVRKNSLFVFLKFTAIINYMTLVAYTQMHTHFNLKIFIFSVILKLDVLMCVCMCMDWGPFMSHLIWGLGTEPGSSAR